jgi:dihydropyrimidinase
MDLIVKNGTIVTATDVYRADIGVRDGKIAQIGAALDQPAARLVDAHGQYVLPGGVDAHTHLDTPGQGTTTADDYLSGTIAAACGGTTTIVNFCFQEPGRSFADLLAHYRRRAEGTAVVDYGFHVVVSDLSDPILEELDTLPAQGITSFKLFMAYRGSLMVDDRTLLRTLESAKRRGALVMVHAENGDACDLLRDRAVAEGKVEPKYHASTRPPRTEAEASARAIALAEVVGAPIYLVHVSCGEAIEEIRRGRDRGVEAFGETCTHYLYFTEADLDRPGFEGAKYVYTPPPRAQHQPALVWKALAGGDLAAVSSDHCPFNFEGQKELGRGDFRNIPNGAPGIEERLMLTYQGVRDGRITLNRFVDLVSTTPARLFGLYPDKGTIAVGSDADLVIWDPEAELQVTRAALHHNVDYTLYEGMRIRGLPRTVTLRGEVIVEDRQHVGRPGTGRFVKRKRFGEERSPASAP